MTTKNSYLLITISAFAIIFIMVIIKMLVNSDVTNVDPRIIENTRAQFYDFKSYEKGENPFPDVTFYNPGGKPVSIKSFEGRYLLINFWATWCPGCVTELPTLQGLGSYLVQEGFPVDVIAVSLDREKTQEELASFLIDNDVAPFALHHDTDKNISRVYPLKGMPTTLLIDPEGNVLYEFLGEADWTNYHIIRLLKEEVTPFMTLLKIKNSP